MSVVVLILACFVSLGHAYGAQTWKSMPEKSKMECCCAQKFVIVAATWFTSAGVMHSLECWREDLSNPLKMLAALLQAFHPASMFNPCGLERSRIRKCQQPRLDYDSAAKRLLSHCRDNTRSCSAALHCLQGDFYTCDFTVQRAHVKLASNDGSGGMSSSIGRAKFETVRIPLREGTHMSARVYTPSQPVVAVVVFAHGGCFTLGDETADENVCMALAGKNCGNLMVIAPHYRQGMQHPYATRRAINDLEDATKFARQRASPGLPLGLIGCSSGGYFTFKLAEVLKADPPDFLVAVCPVAHPGLRADYLVACMRSAREGERWVREGVDTSLREKTDSTKTASPPFHTPQIAACLLGMQFGYFSNDRATMHAAGEEVDRVSGEGTPPMLLILGDADKNVPLRVVAGARRWATRELVLQGRGHETCERLPQAAQEAIREFVQSVLSLY